MSLFKAQPTDLKSKKKISKISLLEEWPLLLFTLLSAILVSFYTSGIAAEFNVTGKLLYLGIGLLAAVLSMLHLGKKTSVWRSVINIKNSWLSREIFLFGLFFTLVVCDFYLFDLPHLLVTSFGILFLFAIDMLYGIATWQWPLKIHSAQTLLIGVSLFAFITQGLSLFVFILSFRLSLYMYRKYAYQDKDWFYSIVRITFPLLSFILIYTSDKYFVLPFTLLLSGEIMDRIEFYHKLNVPDPKVEIHQNN